jgi:signal transduction histidine kinase
VREKGEWNGELAQVTKTGREIIVASRWTLVHDDQGKPLQKLIVNTDITEQKRLEAEVQRAAQLSFVGELAAGLAHEIKNPLAGIQGAVDILIRRRDKTDPEREALEGMRHEVTRIDSTVRALLDRARPRLVSVKSTSLSDVARRAVNLARAQLSQVIAKGGHVTVHFEPPADPVIAPVDAAQIEDAVLNLIINAIDATEGQGEVRIRVARANNSSDEEDEAIIEVSDNGCGISEADLGRIFSPFFTTTIGGTGLGLPAVRRIARAHGGTVEVTSSLGKGSTFTLHLPINRV